MIFEYVFLFTLGLSMGSFLTVVAERFDSAEAFWLGRSHCNECKQVLSWWELIPLVGYLILHGECRHCKKMIPRLYPVFELISGFTFIGLLAAHSGENYWVLAGHLVIASFLLLLLIYDWLNQAFPALLLVMTSLFTLIITSLIIIYAPADRYMAMIHDPILSWLSSPDNLWVGALKGLIVGMSVLGLFALPSRGKWMGYGDVLLIGILGYWLAYPFIVIALMIAFYLGAIGAIWQVLFNRVAKDHRIAFGPFLIISAFILQVWGSELFLFIIKYWGGA